MDFNIELPLNPLSFGQVGINILREIYTRKLNPCIFPIGNIDVRVYRLEDDFKKWLEDGLTKAISSYKHTNPGFRLWHLNDSHHRISDKQILFTFHETDQATPAEVNIANNNTRTLFSSKYSQSVFETFGAKNVGSLPLGFDSTFFKVLKKEYIPGVISFGLGGKLEKRKQHHKILNLWAKKFGNQKEYVLNCALFNPHLPIEVQESFRRQALEGKSYYNINFLPYMENNEAYNDFLNANNIFLDLSLGEGWSLPSFQSAALGKYVVVMFATGIKEWANEKNAILVHPSGKIPLYDGVFFQEGAPFSQGNGFDFSESDFYKAIEIAIKRFNKNPINEEGLKLQKEFTYSKMVDKIVKELENIS